MDKIDDNKEDKRKIEDYKKNPMINAADSLNRSMYGDLSQLTKGSCLTRIITTVIIIGISFFLIRYLNHN
ncbi:hypothetical protein [Clostridium estertheticum]|uniref:hypothetical protein n=1 Tax=Clostridium estertheticum TaxID=238834 RepID=UPI001C0AFE0B|nr:hypothetical protein [Clostridium estertheticum]MBU3179325.1 hypothetical protein [Clostridium estertheticum]MBW9172518.1 hypothetical protein [Clostridium estertheticum]MCB2357170.1 hypothetical protein [Clostridium estertheticum]WAG40385.1 hypothetical protein LL065_19270 [Clostridium estertheticum]WLC76525.1 hypothetical protein KTC99_06890 [Clostridium estertheticum]